MKTIRFAEVIICYQALTAIQTICHKEKKIKKETDLEEDHLYIYIM